MCQVKLNLYWESIAKHVVKINYQKGDIAKVILPTLNRVKLMIKLLQPIPSL